MINHELEFTQFTGKTLGHVAITYTVSIVKMEMIAHISFYGIKMPVFGSAGIREALRNEFWK